MTAFDPHRLIEAAAPLLRLAVAPEDREGVARHLAAAARLQAALDAVSIEDEEEPAPVFAPQPLDDAGRAP